MNNKCYICRQPATNIVLSFGIGPRTYPYTLCDKCSKPYRLQRNLNYIVLNKKKEPQ